jgi:hypothetical protein
MLLWQVRVVVGAINVVSRLHMGLVGNSLIREQYIRDPKLQGNDSLWLIKTSRGNGGLEGNINCE